MESAKRAIPAPEGGGDGAFCGIFFTNPDQLQCERGLTK
jgi:hypothetical protein